MMKLSSTIGGLAGAATLTVLNETVKQYDKDAPRLDLLGMNAVAKVMKGPKGVPLTEKVKPVSLAADMISNALYYGMANTGKTGSTFLRGALLGIAAGVSAITLAKPLHLDETPVTRTTKTKLMTVGYYLIGGLVAAAVINLLKAKK